MVERRISERSADVLADPVVAGTGASESDQQCDQVQRRQPMDRHFRRTRTGVWSRIPVQDRGIGISSSDLPHIFEPFYRGRSAVDGQIQGSGLGLSLVKEIVDAHGGELT